jgi:hypothetical protein
MPEGPLGGPRPAANCNIEVNITLESFYVSEDDMEDFKTDHAKMREFIELFEQKFNVQVKDVDVTSQGARGIDVISRTDTWMVYEADEGSYIDTLVDWVGDNVGPVTSVQVRCG